jgi:hypothetical protein
VASVAPNVIERIALAESVSRGGPLSAGVAVPRSKQRAATEPRAQPCQSCTHGEHRPSRVCEGVKSDSWGITGLVQQLDRNATIVPIANPGYVSCGRVSVTSAGTSEGAARTSSTPNGRIQAKSCRVAKTSGTSKIRPPHRSRFQRGQADGSRRIAIPGRCDTKGLQLGNYPKYIREQIVRRGRE